MLSVNVKPHIIAAILFFTLASAAGCQPKSANADQRISTSQAATAMKAWSGLKGDWIIEGRFRYEPDAKWMTFTATADVSSAMNGCGLIERIENVDGSYSAVRVFGFNNADDRYEMTNFSGGGRIAAMSGSRTEGVHEFIFEGSVDGGAVNNISSVKSVYRFVQENKIELQEYAVTNDGVSYLGAQATYRRK